MQRLCSFEANSVAAWGLVLLGLAISAHAQQPKDPPKPKKEDAENSIIPTFTSNATTEQIDALKGKWRVVRVHRDGKHQHGQVGQEVDDIITITMDLDGALLFG